MLLSGVTIHWTGLLVQEYLGTIISSEGLYPSPKKVEAILNVALPTDISE